MTCYLCAHPKYPVAIMGRAQVPLCTFCARNLAASEQKIVDDEAEQRAFRSRK